MNCILGNLRWITAIVALAAISWGDFTADGPLIWSGVGTMSCVAILFGLRIWRRAKRTSRDLDHTAGDRPEGGALRPRPSSDAARTDAPNAGAESSSSDNLDSLVEQMLADGRFGLLLRPQIASNLAAEMLTSAQEELDRHMALVPDGDVQLEPNRLSAAAELDVEEELLERVTIHVAVTFLDRYPVTNRQYLAFVAAGGYEQMSIWDPAIWPAVLDFVDTTGKPGPRYWIGGRCPPGKEDHPVVGVCWYEAAAFARWVGRRLPTDAEWVKAASWPVNLSPTTCVQRKYPWGSTMERQHANLWGSGPGDTTPVSEFASGVSVGGVYQLIGNVWEWTTDDFLWVVAAGEDRSDQPLLKTIRGGAFDTYFDNQATAQFASGESPLGRKHNIGFRCALGICDLAATVPEPEPAEQEDCQLEAEEFEVV